MGKTPVLVALPQKCPPRGLTLMFEGDSIVEEDLREQLGPALIDPQGHLETLHARLPEQTVAV